MSTSDHDCLLVPLDGSHLAEAVLPFVARIATSLNARVLLLHVLEHRAPSEIHGERHLVESADARTYLETAADQLRARGVSEIVWHVHDNRERDVALAIVQHAEEYTARLIVLANHGDGGWREFFFGSIAQQVIRQGSTPVVLLPIRERSQGPDETNPASLTGIVMATSGAGANEPALETTAWIALGYGVPVRVVAVVDTMASMSGEERAIASLVPSASRALLEIQEHEMRARVVESVESLQAMGIDASGVLLRGDPASSIVKEATRIGAGLLALATHGRSELGAIWTGSVGSRVLATYGKPLLLVRAPVDAS